jgi:hypothetical protein
MTSGLAGSVLWGGLVAACGFALIGITVRSHAREARKRAAERMAFQQPRDFMLWHRSGWEEYYNEPPRFESPATITDWSAFLPTQGWVYRKTFQPGIQRGRVTPDLTSVPISVWNPTTVSVLATEIHYLVLIETIPEPVRVWDVTRGDILWFVGNGDNYLTIFPSPFSP